MAKIVVTTEMSSYATRHADPNEKWDRDDTDGHVENVLAYVETVGDRSYYGDSCGKELPGINIGSTVYAVVVEYETGDSFGRDGGQAKVVDVFDNSGEAIDLATAIREDSGNKDSDWNITVNGVGYYCGAWKGYFERFKSAEVWQLLVRGSYNPYAESTSIGFRIGR